MSPPKRALQFLRWFCREDCLEEIEGDLTEIFEKQLKTAPRNARWSFAWSVVRYFRPEFLKSLRDYYQPDPYGMYKSYFRLGWRNITRNRAYSLINIGGLAVGITAVILTWLWVHDELTFNRSFKNHDHIGKLMVHNGGGTYENHPIPLASELRTLFPGDFKYVVMSTQAQEYIISAGENKFMQVGNFMEAAGPEMLGMEMLSGSWRGFRNPHSIFLAETLSKKLFGDLDPVGETVTIDNELPVVVAGVFRDFPGNSQFSKISFMAPWDLLISSYEYIKSHENDWEGNFLNIYVELKPDAEFDLASKKIKDVKLRHVSVEKAKEEPELFLLPMKNWHLYSTFENRKQVVSEQLKLVWFISLIGIFILIVAAINFMNLCTARSEKRAKEVGLRKTMGSFQRQLIFQFFCESMLTVSLAALLALVAGQLALPWFNEITGKQLRIPWTSEAFWFLFVFFVAVTGFLAGIYPSFYLSSFNPAKVLKGTFKINYAAPIPRKILITAQFTISVLLTIGTVIVYQQLRFVKERPVGYTRDGLIMIRKTSPEFQGRSEVISTELKNSGLVSAVAESASGVTSIWGFNAGFSWEGKNPDFQESFGTIAVSADYGKTIGWQFIDGRDFSNEIAGDSSAFIINEAAVKYMGLKQPVGKTIRWDSEYFDSGDYTIIGVVKDMVMNSPFEHAKPMIFFLQGYKGWILVKSNPDSGTHETLSAIETVFKRIVPSAPFDYRFASDSYAAKFKNEECIGELALVLAVLAVTISCLGLFGLASFVVEQRNKEIGIRKVLGASLVNLWQMLSRDFIVLVTTSCIIAIPVAYYFMNNWLQNYQYRIEISWWIFLLTGFGALTIAIFTVSFHTIKAALRNPVNSLKSE